MVITVADPERLDADPDPTFQINTDLNTNFTQLVKHEKQINKFIHIQD